MDNVADVGDGAGDRDEDGDGDADIVLEYAIESVDARQVTLSYAVENGSDRPIFLLTPLVEPGLERSIPDPGKVYSFVDEGGVLHVTKRLWEVPDDIDVYAPEVPCVTRVAPGARFVERVTCALPIRVSYPYRFEEVDPSGAEPEMCTIVSAGVAFSVGYLDEPEELLHLTPAADVGPLSYRVYYRVAAEYQRILEGEPLEVQVSVQDTA